MAQKQQQKPNKIFEKKASVASLGTPDKDGWLTKQGGNIKTWKKRWFVLKDNTLYYFKTQKDGEQTGEIKLEKNSSSSIDQKTSKKKNKFYLSVTTTTRTYLMFSESEESAKQWVEKINRSVEGLKGGSSGASSSGGSGSPAKTPDTPPVPVVEAVSPPSITSDPTHSTSDSPDADTKNATGGGETKSLANRSVREKIQAAKNTVSFLKDPESKVLEFWQIWYDSIPGRDALLPGMAIDFHLSTSANLQKLTWRTAGPQNIFIQKMVDFFWNVGAPESEIDRLNDVGACINPIRIGSWIDMSSKGGMDGGWYFPVDIPLRMAIEAAEDCETTKAVTDWAEKNNVDKSFSVGRDMGAAPPRQTEIRMRLPGNDFQNQLQIGLEAFDTFDFPPLSSDALAILRSHNEPGLCMSIIISVEGFVRLGLLLPEPNQETVKKLCSIANATLNYDELISLQGALGCNGPSYAEFQYLKEGFGYGVYKEGFDIVFHFHVGSETID